MKGHSNGRRRECFCEKIDVTLIKHVRYNYNTVSNLLGSGSVPRVIRVTGSAPTPDAIHAFFKVGCFFSNVGGYPNCQDI